MVDPVKFSCHMGLLPYKMWLLFLIPCHGVCACTSRKSQKLLGPWSPASEDGGMADPVEGRSSATCVTSPYLVVLAQMIRV